MKWIYIQIIKSNNKEKVNWKKQQRQPPIPLTITQVNKAERKLKMYTVIQNANWFANLCLIIILDRVLERVYSFLMSHSLARMRAVICESWYHFAVIHGKYYHGAMVCGVCRSFIRTYVYIEQSWKLCVSLGRVCVKYVLWLQNIHHFERKVDGGESCDSTLNADKSGLLEIHKSANDS